MSLPFAWSFTTLKNFESCPFKFYSVKVAKRWVETYGDQQSWGNIVHDAFQKRINAGSPLPPEVRYLEPVASKIAALPGEKYPEFKFAVDDAFQPTKWSGAWSRGAADLWIVNGPTGALLDYKTGKRRPDEQLNLYAGYAFAHWPDVTKIHTNFVWLKDKKIDKDVIEREQIGPVWQAFTQRVHTLEEAYAKDKWPKRPSGLCRGWCPVKDCEFWEEKK